MREDWMRDISGLGGLPIYIIAVIVAWAVGETSLTFQLLAGIVFSYLITILFRLLWFRARPDAQKHNNLMERIDASSFPSIHAMRSSVFWGLLALHFANPILYLLCAIVIGCVSCTRVLLRRHHIFDVIAGIAIGLVLAYVSMQNANIWLSITSFAGI